MNYTQIPYRYKYEVLADAVYARELEHFHYNFDRVNYERLLVILPTGPYKADIKNRLEETKVQMGNVDAIYNALVGQIDDKEEYEKAVKVVTERRILNEVHTS